MQGAFSLTHSLYGWKWKKSRKVYLLAQTSSLFNVSLNEKLGTLKRGLDEGKNEEMKLGLARVCSTKGRLRKQTIVRSINALGSKFF